MTAMYGEGMAIAERMGVLSALRQRSFRQERQMLRDRQGRLLRTFNLQRAHTLQGGTLTLKRSDWLQVLYDAVAPRVPVRFATTVQSLHETPTGVDVSFSDGTTNTYDLVVGADGLHSAVRGLAFGSDFKRPVGLGVMTFLLDGCGDLLARAGLAPFTVHEWFVPNRYVEVTALAEDVVAGIFVYPSLPGHVIPSVETRADVLRAQFADVGGGAQAVIDAVRDPSLIYCDDLAQVVMPRWSAGRVVLVGDAAYALTPMLGAGGGKGMRGAYTLAQELTRSADHTTAFARYEGVLRPSIELLQRQSLQMGRFATTGNPLLMAVRGALFKYMPETLVVRMRSASPKGTTSAP